MNRAAKAIAVMLLVACDAPPPAQTTEDAPLQAPDMRFFPDFRGDALAWMQTNARTPPPELLATFDGIVQAGADGVGCTRNREDDRLFVADFDADGHQEALGLWTLSSCGGNRYKRFFGLLHRTPDGWSMRYSGSLSSERRENRAVLAIRDGALVIGGSGASDDSDAPAATVRIPAPGE